MVITQSYLKEELGHKPRMVEETVSDTLKFFKEIGYI